MKLAVSVHRCCSRLILELHLCRGRPNTWACQIDSAFTRTLCSFCFCLPSVRLRAAALQLADFLCWVLRRFSWGRRCRVHSSSTSSSISDPFFSALVSSFPLPFHHLVIRMCFSSLPREAKNGYHLWAESCSVSKLLASSSKRREEKKMQMLRNSIHLPVFHSKLGLCVLCFWVYLMKLSGGELSLWTEWPLNGKHLSL